MIRLIEALDFRCLRYISQRLGNFHVLVGPNASGKTTFLDVVAFLGDLVSEGLDEAISARSQNWQDLVWKHSGRRFELAIELEIPDAKRQQLAGNYSAVRYEVAIGSGTEIEGECGILAEKVLLLEQATCRETTPPSLFPMDHLAPETLITTKGAKGTKTIVNKVPEGNDNFYVEIGTGWSSAFKLGTRRSALGNLPEDESKFPVATWLKGLLIGGAQKITLNSQLMRRPSSPTKQRRQFLPDGSNLPWMISHLKKANSRRYQDWIQHLRTSLPDLQDIETQIREEDRHCYLILCYDSGLKVPSWMVSDGTLRLLALTLPAYLEGIQGVYLIEEPENGIHPRAIETAFQSLSSVYDAQILLATHSPVILSVADQEHLLCFSKTKSGATDIVVGTKHPKLRQWKGETNLGVLFAGGVLG
jgi:predicted ATPase